MAGKFLLLVQGNANDIERARDTLAATSLKSFESTSA
jgi:hypothetical protein